MSTSLNKISQKIKKCRQCQLWQTRTQAVPGEGNPRAKILIIGEAPGAEEDKKGQPFCGRAGKFLDELLNLAHLNRQKIFITNVVKCRPPKNRRPKKEEIEKCKPWLEKQIRILKPKLIITLGALALNWFFPEAKISQFYGQIRKFRISNFEFRIFFTYHPAAAFHRGNLRQRLQKDFKKLNKILKKFQRLNQ